MPKNEIFAQDLQLAKSIYSKFGTLCVSCAMGKKFPILNW